MISCLDGEWLTCAYLYCSNICPCLQFLVTPINLFSFLFKNLQYMALICWSAGIFFEQFCLWVWRLFFSLLFLIIAFFRRVLLKGESSDLLEAVQMNWLLCPFLHYNGVVFLTTSVACYGVSLKTHGPHVTALGIHISQLQSLGLSKITPGSAAKCLKTLAALAAGQCWGLQSP